MTAEYKFKTVNGFAKLKLGEWYNIFGREDYTELVAVIDWMTKIGLRYELSEDKKSVRMYDDYYRIEGIPQGFTEDTEVGKGKIITVTHGAERGKYIPSYRIWKGDKLIAIET